MRLRRIIPVILALAITVGAFVFFSTRKDNSRGAVTLWVQKEDVLFSEIEKLVGSFNADMTRKTLPVEIKSFENEEELVEAYETGSPDILCCTHFHAFSLHEREKLADISAEETFVSPNYPKSLQSRHSSIGTGFFPLGISVPVAVLNNSLAYRRSFENLEDFFAAAEDHTKRTAKPFFAFDSSADLFYICTLRSGEEFNGGFDDISKSERLLRLYNLFAEATFAGSISYVGEDGIKYLANKVLPCVITSSDKLTDIDPDTVTVLAVPAPADSKNTDTLGTACGFAVTNGGCRSKRDTAAFISWAFSENRSTQAALACMLVPAAAGGKAAAGSTEALLIDIAENSLISLPAPNSNFISDKPEFEESFRKETERLLP